MGRLKKYKTEEELKVANQLSSKKYYWKNKKREDDKAKARYHNNKNLSNN